MKQKILNVIDDCVSALLYYDRKNCEYLGVGEIERAIKSEIITKEEMVEKFKSTLYKMCE